MKPSPFALFSSCLFAVSLLCQPVLAIDKEIMDTEISYEDLKEHLLKRYTPIVEKLTAGENAGIKALTSAPSSGNNAPYPGAISPWWQSSVATPLANMPAVADGQIDHLFARTLAVLLTDKGLLRPAAHPSNHHPGGRRIL